MAGATIPWTGLVSSDVSVGGNFAGGAVPALNDFVTWSTITPYAPTSGTWTNAIAKFEMSAGAGFGTGGSVSRDAGASGTPVVLSAVSTSVRFANLGNVYVTSTGTVAAAAFEMPIGCTATLTAGTWTSPVAVGVNMVVGASAVIVNPKSIGAVWTIAASGTAITSFKGNGLWNVESRNITDFRLDAGGRLVTTGTTVITAGEASGGSTVNHQASGNATLEVRGRGTTFTPAGNPNGTGTPPTATITRYTGANAYLSVPGITLAGTITNVGPELVAGGAPS